VHENSVLSDGVDHLDPADRAAPPADADDWTDEQWIEWLKATDADATAEHGLPPATLAGRVVHSTGGQVLGLSMLGLAQAIYGQRDEKVVIVAEANSEPEKDRPFDLHLDADHPEQSFVVLKPPSSPPDGPVEPD
jgi:hypothetical protein